jgi:glutathione-regulated potassium-efflux system ancillary protein KefC/glutathione-regulated potassium-efflux system protein KefB
MGTTLYEAVVLLGAAVLFVPLFQRMGFGAVLGYLAVGVLLGPFGLRLIAEVESIRHIGELGVVFLLFVIGLELQPSRLWALRRSIFGYGTAQVLISGALIALVALALGLAPIAAVVVGIGLSLSSTAFVLRLLAERGELNTRHGRLSFAILLFQDLAAIPMIAIIPLLAVMPATEVSAAREIEPLAIARAIGIIALVVVGGRYLTRPFFRMVAATGVQEMFTAAALFVVIGTALLVQFAGLSMALGAFLAGVLLAESEYRHELEGDITPFRGLLLGLFFISVGMALDLGLIAQRPLLLAALVVGLVALKAVVLWALAWFAGHGKRCAVNLALYTSQGGEFAFVLFGLAAGATVLERGLADLMTVVVTLSMVTTPLLLAARRWLVPSTPAAAPRYDEMPHDESRVIIAGFGRFGQIIARVLRMSHIPFTALEASFEQVEFVRRYGGKIYFGDASRLELLQAAGADKAELFVLAIDDVESSIRTAQLVKRHFPNLRIYARARNRHHAYQLMNVGVEQIVRETFYSSLELGRGVLRGLGFQPATAENLVRQFGTYDEALLRRQHAFHQDEERLIASTKEAAEELERVFEQDTAARVAR